MALLVVFEPISCKKEGLIEAYASTYRLTPTIYKL